MYCHSCYRYPRASARTAPTLQTHSSTQSTKGHKTSKEKHTEKRDASVVRSVLTAAASQDISEDLIISDLSVEDLAPTLCQVKGSLIMNVSLCIF